MVAVNADTNAVTMRAATEVKSDAMMREAPVAMNAAMRADMAVVGVKSSDMAIAVGMMTVLVVDMALLAETTTKTVPAAVAMVLLDVMGMTEAADKKTLLATEALPIPQAKSLAWRATTASSIPLCKAFKASIRR